MATHFGTMQFVDVGTYAQLKNIKAETGSSKYIYCEHASHYSIVISWNSMTFQYILNRDGGADETDWDTLKAGALRIG